VVAFLRVELREPRDPHTSVMVLDPCRLVEINDIAASIA